MKAQPCFLAAGAMDRLGSRSGIIMDCVAWYRSDLPGHTVPIGWLVQSSWWNQDPLTWSITVLSA